MKSLHLTVVFVTFILCESSRASSTVLFQLGDLTTSDSVTLPAGTLWAIITGNNGQLPGGLSFNGALSVDTDIQAITEDFAGATIAPNELVGGGVVLHTGNSGSGLINELFQIDLADFPELGLNAGDQFGVYWFPGYSTTSNTLPSGANFEIGGFHQTVASSASGGNTGMQIPPDGDDVIIAYFDSEFTGGATPYDPVLFQAVMVPEPSTALLFMASALLLSRRRR